MTHTQHTIETEKRKEEDYLDELISDEEMEEKMTYEGLDEEQIRQRVQSFFVRMEF